MVLVWETAKELQHLDNQGSQLVVLHQAGVVSEGYNLNKQHQVKILFHQIIIRASFLSMCQSRTLFGFIYCKVFHNFN